jgi:transposase
MKGRPTVRVTTLLKKLLGIEHLLVTGFDIEDEALIIDVRPSWRKRRCSCCGKRRGQYDTLKPRRWRHLDFGGVRVYLRYGLRRVFCPDCGVVAEHVPWCDITTSRFTSRFEDAVGFLTQRCDKTSVQEMFSIAWVTVGQIVKRVVGRYRPGDPLDGLRLIGVDELSYRKGHNYVTTVTDHESGRIVWAKEGKNAETLMSFFEELGDERCLAIEAVTMDMSKAYIKAVKEKVPHAQIVFDRFHVQKLVSEAMNETRREEWQRLRQLGNDEAVRVKGLLWPMRKNPWNLTPSQSDRLSTLQQDNERLYRAYLLKESFAAILDRRQPNVVKKKLEDWLSWASRSRLPAFVRVGRTIRKHLDDIVSYIRWGLTNGIVEGLNNKLRVITHRAYGFHSASALIGMIMLCCTNIWLSPPRVRLAK